MAQNMSYVSLIFYGNGERNYIKTSQTTEITREPDFNAKIEFSTFTQIWVNVVDFLIQWNCN